MPPKESGCRDLHLRAGKLFWCALPARQKLICGCSDLYQWLCGLNIFNAQMKVHTESSFELTAGQQYALYGVR